MVSSASFPVAFLREILVGNLNVIGLVSGFAGGIVMTVFGMPSLSVLGAGSYTEFQVTPRIRLYNFLSRVGLLLLAVGFACQLVAAVIPTRTQPITASLVDVWTAALAFVSAVFWAASAVVRIKFGFDNDVELTKAFGWSSRLNAVAAIFAALAAGLQAAKPFLLA
jgi:hypothetical protein